MPAGTVIEFVDTNKVTVSTFDAVPSTNVVGGTVHRGQVKRADSDCGGPRFALKITTPKGHSYSRLYQ